MSDNNQAVTPQNTVGVAPGWYPDTTDARLVRYWDGHAWTEHVQPARGYVGTGTPGTYGVPVALGNSAPVQQVVVHQERKRVNHLLHLVLTIVTVGLWLPVWVILAFAKS